LSLFNLIQFLISNLFTTFEHKFISNIMNIQEINKIFIKITDNISSNRLLDAFDTLNDLISTKDLSNLKEPYLELKGIYDNILRYSFAQINDPERDKIYQKLIQSTYKLVDRVKISLLYEQKHFATVNIYNETNFEFLNNGAQIENNILEQKSEKDIFLAFKRIWLSPKLDEGTISFLNRINENEDFDWHIKALIVSALTMSNLQYFDQKKLILLFNFYNNSPEKVWQRALVGIILNIYLHSKRIVDSFEIVKKLEELKKEKDFDKNLTYIILQLIRTKETEKISKQLQEEIIPEVVKFKPKIEDKLKLDDILGDMSSEDKNPDWESVFGDSPELFGKLEEFSKMQIEGSDVFMSAFAMLKHFDFFKEPANWFLPFYKENDTIWEAFKFEKTGFDSDLFIEGLEKSAFLCNSDKYSFILNVRYMPEAQKTMMLEMFNAEVEGMNELIKDDELLNKSMMDRYQFTQYIQDLYRFFKLHPYKNEFIDIFNEELDLYNSPVLTEMWFDPELYKKIGALYFEKEYFKNSLEVYKILFRKGINELEVLEKIAYSYQKLGKFGDALNFYKKAEFFDTHIAWSTKKIAMCYRELGNTDKAIEYYLKAEKLEPENLYVQAHLGHSYLRIKEYEKALQHYFKVEYFAPSNTMILRPIAWCSFVLGRFENAQKYYQKLRENNKADKFDYLNMGHVEWCTNNIENTVKFYKKAHTLNENNDSGFKTDFYEDKPYLIKHGIPELEIGLMIDYLLSPHL